MALRNLLLAGGVSHDFEATVPALVALAEAEGIETVATDDVEGGLIRLDEGFDLLTVHCLRWSMTQHEKYVPQRARWALSLSGAARDAIRRHVAAGRGLVGIHTASISFDDWPEWGALLGARWVWGRSHHPPPGPLQVRIDDPGHPVTAGLRNFSVADELYSDLDIGPTTRVLASARADGAWQPVALVKEEYRGRQAYLALGHDGASLAQPDHAALVRRAFAWCVGRPDEGVPAR